MEKRSRINDSLLVVFGVFGSGEVPLDVEREDYPPEVRLQVGITYFHAGEYARAEREFSSVLEEAGSEELRLAALVNRGAARTLLARLEEAEEDLRTVLEEGGFSPRFFVLLALHSIRRGELEEAERLLSETIRDRTSYRYPLLLRGWTRYFLRDFSGSREDFRSFEREPALVVPEFYPLLYRFFPEVHLGNYENTLSSLEELAASLGECWEKVLLQYVIGERDEAELLVVALRERTPERRDEHTCEALFLSALKSPPHLSRRYAEECAAKPVPKRFEWYFAKGAASSKFEFPDLISKIETGEGL